MIRELNQNEIRLLGELLFLVEYYQNTGKQGTLYSLSMWFGPIIPSESLATMVKKSKIITTKESQYVVDESEGRDPIIVFRKGNTTHGWTLTAVFDTGTTEKLLNANTPVGPLHEYEPWWADIIARVLICKYFDVPETMRSDLLTTITHWCPSTHHVAFFWDSEEPMTVDHVQMMPATVARNPVSSFTFDTLWFLNHPRIHAIKVNIYLGGQRVNEFCMKPDNSSKSDNEDAQMDQPTPREKQLEKKLKEAEEQNEALCEENRELRKHRYQHVHALANNPPANALRVKVSGPVQNGKTLVLACIERALHQDLALDDIVVVSPDLDTERTMGSVGVDQPADHQKPEKGTVIVLEEHFDNDD